MQEQDMIKAIGKVTDAVIENTMLRFNNSFDAFKQVVEHEVNKKLNSRPVLHISINDQPPNELSNRASKILPRLITNAKLKLNSLLIGPAGCGKTTAAHQLAEALGVQFGSVCLTAGASETWLFGRQTPAGFVEGMFSKIYREGGVFLADEMDAADANLLLSINTALSHDMMLNPMSGEVIRKHDSFVFIGAGFSLIVAAADFCGHKPGYGLGSPLEWGKNWDSTGDKITIYSVPSHDEQQNIMETLLKFINDETVVDTTAVESYIDDEIDF